MHQKISHADFEKIRIGGLMTSTVTRDDMAYLMVKDCEERGYSKLPTLVFSSNGQGISLATSDPAFKVAMDNADIIHADGMSVVVGSKFFAKKSLPARSATTDFFHDAAEAAVKNGLRFFFLGSSADQNTRAVAAVREKYPTLQVSGQMHGFFPEEESEAICQIIVEAETDVLWVGLGKPKQELWAVKYKPFLKNVGWVKTCGGLYGHLAGDERRAPAWMQKIGLEWLFRLSQSPKKLTVRYLKTNPHALWCMLKNSK